MQKLDFVQQQVKLLNFFASILKLEDVKVGKKAVNIMTL